MTSDLQLSQMFRVHCIYCRRSDDGCRISGWTSCRAEAGRELCSPVKSCCRHENMRLVLLRSAPAAAVNLSLSTNIQKSIESCSHPEKPGDVWFHSDPVSDPMSLLSSSHQHVHVETSVSHRGTLSLRTTGSETKCLVVLSPRTRLETVQRSLNVETMFRNTR